MSEDLPPAPAVAHQLFGAAYDRVVEYVRMLATDGVVRGLVGPREVPRLWDRHVVNCAVVSELIGPGERVADVGSGAGLPGIVLALARPDLQVVLVEPLARRTVFLEECRTALRIENLTVYRGRAEQPETVKAIGRVDVVTSRAVASLDKLAAWCLPLLRPDGRMLAIKGESAATEVEKHRAEVARRGGTRIEVKRCGIGVVEPPATVIVVFRRDSAKRRRVQK